MMNEEQLPAAEFESGPAANSDAIATGSPSEGSVEVVSGIYSHSHPIVGMSVGEARRDLEERLNIDPNAIAAVDGHAADEDTILMEGQVLTFLTPAGEKGTTVALAAA